MPADLASRPSAAVTTRGAAGLSRILASTLLVLLGVLLVEVLLEAWVQELLGNRTLDADGLLVGTVPSWPKYVKNGLLVALVVISALKITIEKRWREFRTKADIAIIVLALIMIVAGLLGTSGPGLIAQALFVYFRGAIVFYAVRALSPTWAQVKRVLWVVGTVIAVNVLVALVQLVVGEPAYTGLGWVDTQWALTNRTQGLLDHPNHLGHILGVVLIGMLAFMVDLPKVTRRWWILFGLAALGLAATQSRESLLATLLGGVLIWYLRRGGGRVILIGCVLVGVLAVGNQVLRPGNLSELAYRLKGMVSAVKTPDGQEHCDGYTTTRACVAAKKVAPREVRLLFIQQGFKLWLHSPLLGYGVGQFGGIVAEQNDPNWDKDPRFGPGGFNLHDMDGTTVDSFWLHEGVETGALGLIAYLAWLALIAAPLFFATRRFRRGPPPPPSPDAAVSEATGLWAIAAIVFAVIVAGLSPALEDPLFPPLLFFVLGVAWVMRAGTPAGQPPTVAVNSSNGDRGTTA
jgi:hypothetical protein